MRAELLRVGFRQKGKLMVRLKKSKREMPTVPSPKLFFPLILIITSMILGMILLEYLKHIIFTSLSMWESHIVTVIYSTVIAAIISYLVMNKLRALNLKVKTLRGLLPICSHCKKIRDDKGYWNQIEKYIHEHSEADFTHGICPECAKKFFSK